MTWHRIDENTYIDDTLVTCAEYQLFIDEMREQGKYYQPDHWTSYQFPEGRAREPVLGVRFHDAEEFCDWLSEREQKWYFRLPFQVEAVNFPPCQYDQAPIGYWIYDDNPEVLINQFTWIGNIPDDAHFLDINRTSRRYGYLLEQLDDEEELFGNRIDINSLRIKIRTITDALSLVRSRDRMLYREAIRSAANKMGFIHNNIFELEYALEFIKQHMVDFSLVSLKVVNRNFVTDCFQDILAFQRRLLGYEFSVEGIRIVKEIEPSIKTVMEYID